MKKYETNEIEIQLDKYSIKETTKVLDIGGGGEGVISELYGKAVIAIDIREEELKEVKNDKSMKLVMDARDLSFYSNQFDIVTAFYSFMYMSESDVIKVLSEMSRVLKPGGKIEIWDIALPSISEVDSELFIVNLDININDKNIKTGYGVNLSKDKRTLDWYTEVIGECRLTIDQLDIGNEGQFHIIVK